MTGEQRAAVDALRERGVDNGEELLAYGNPDQILAACRRWDKREGVGPGLLASFIRNQDFPEEPKPSAPKLDDRHDRFAIYAERYPEGSIAEPHARLQERRWPEDERCGGDMIVVDAIYPLITVVCDRCDFEAAYPLRSLGVLDGQEAAP
jgi:hypothetical protein